MSAREAGSTDSEVAFKVTHEVLELHINHFRAVFTVYILSIAFNIWTSYGPIFGGKRMPLIALRPFLAFFNTAGFR
jgi:hypothetical protein